MTIGTDGWMAYAGIDLAADPARTGIGVVAEHSEQQRLVVQDASLGADDDALIELVTGAAKVGVDTPLGWPQPFVEHLQAHSTGTLAGVRTSDIDWRRSMALRRTDMVVRQRLGITPMSVATDRIAYPALRWSVVEARLRGAGTDCSRDGSGRICEVYPAAALRCWGLPHRGYKSAAAQAVRERIVEGIGVVFPHLDWNGFGEQCCHHDDVLDAVLAALMARETAKGRTWTPEDGERDLALSEGWIHIPRP